ncbi:unnamed protein product [Protopolystoma xenopodis]|uniref:Uncharacterized protein n=1 Tax=Protopolystoma xenopodis TaxID=117903 RepID=A0A448X8K9_9PLAT|nr:unnamed protein product [Protopolystoma xenopodis]
MRFVSFVDHIRFRDVTTLTSSGFCLYDVDNDGVSLFCGHYLQDNELVVGHWDSGKIQRNGEANIKENKGIVYVMKYGEIWKVACNLGMSDDSIPHDATAKTSKGPCDVLVSYSDRVVRLFRWFVGESKQQPCGELVALLKWELAGQIGRIDLHNKANSQGMVS